MEQVASLPAAKSAVEAPSVASLRVPCYCEENVWRLAYRRLHDKQKRLDGSKENNETITYYHVVFVSNPKACVPMFQQLASTNRGKAVFWDYHVILLQETTTPTTTPATDTKSRKNPSSDMSHDASQMEQYDDGINAGQSPAGGLVTTGLVSVTTLVWDIDSHLPCPCPLNDYLNKVFPNVTSWPDEYIPYFR
jgi:hypothetical protein